MKLTRIYTGDDNRSHFEDLDIPLQVSLEGRQQSTDAVPAIGGGFTLRAPVPPRDFHNAPRRQFVAVLAGALEVECGDGASRRFGAGDVFFADDLGGEGHKTRDAESPVRLFFLYIPADFDPSAWRPRG
jgi:hypothetical protein